MKARGKQYKVYLSKLAIQLKLELEHYQELLFTFGLFFFFFFFFKETVDGIHYSLFYCEPPNFHYHAPDFSKSLLLAFTDYKAIPEVLEEFLKGGIVLSIVEGTNRYGKWLLSSKSLLYKEKRTYMKL